MCWEGCGRCMPSGLFTILQCFRGSRGSGAIRALKVDIEVHHQASI